MGGSRREPRQAQGVCFNKRWHCTYTCHLLSVLNRIKTDRTVICNYRSVIFTPGLNSSPRHNDSSPHLCFQITCKWFDSSFSTCAVKQQRGASALPQMALLTDTSCLTTDLQLYGVITSRWESELETVIIPQMEAETPPVPVRHLTSTICSHTVCEQHKLSWWFFTIFLQWPIVLSVLRQERLDGVSITYFAKTKHASSNAVFSQQQHFRIVSFLCATTL